MATHIALLRGINVSGQKIIPMAGLKAMFVVETPSKEGVKALEAARNPTDDFVVAKSAVYVLVRDGYGKTQFSNNFVEKKLGVRATSRNMESSLKLLALAESLGAPA